MKKLLSVLLAAALTASLACAAVAAGILYEPSEEARDYAPAGWYKIICAEAANRDYAFIYDAPSGTRNEILCRVEDGDPVYVFYTTPGIDKGEVLWANCLYESERTGTVAGFIPASSLRPDPDSEAEAPEPTPAPVAIPAGDPSEASQPDADTDPDQGPVLRSLTVYNCNYWVSLRETPSTEAKRLAEVHKGTQLQGYVYDSVWYACYYEGKFGYILARYLH